MSVLEIVQRLERLEEHCKIEATKVARLWRMHEGVLPGDHLHLAPAPATRPGETAGVRSEAEPWKTYDTLPASLNAKALEESLQSVRERAITYAKAIDAMTIERESLKARIDYLERDRRFRSMQSAANEQAANASAARVAELYGEANGLRRDAAATKNRMWVLETGNSEVHNLITSLESQLESVADRAAAAETAMESAPAASDAAGTEPVAWGVMVDGKIDRTSFVDAIFLDKATAEIWCRIDSLQGKGTVVPLYAAPQPASGWLTPEERGFFTKCRGIAEQVRKDWERLCSTHERDEAAETVKFLDALLARSSPPEVVLPAPPFAPCNVAYSDWMMCLEAVGKALAAAGVPWKEVGRE